MREAEVLRKTSETNIKAKIVLTGDGESSLNTGIGFFDHMLTLLSKHGLIRLSLTENGD